MYVIRVRYGDNLWKFLVGVENQRLVISSIASKSMVFFSRVDASLMCVLIESYLIRLNPELVIDYIAKEHESYFSLPN